MSPRESPSPWLPSSAQVAMASERAILASLDLNLQLAVSALLAEHPAFGYYGPREAPEPQLALVALAASIRILAESLHQLIAGYRDATEHLLGDEEPDDDF